MVNTGRMGRGGVLRWTKHRSSNLSRTQSNSFRAHSRPIGRRRGCGGPLPTRCCRTLSLDIVSLAFIAHHLPTLHFLPNRPVSRQLGRSKRDTYESTATVRRQCPAFVESMGLYEDDHGQIDAGVCRIRRHVHSPFAASVRYTFFQ